MINWKLIFKILGHLLMLEAMLMAFCMIPSIIADDDDIMAFILGIIITIGGSAALYAIGYKAQNNLSRRDSYLVVTLAWVVFSLFGSSPFLLSGYIPDFTNAFFETISGFTTTGCSIIEDIESFPHGLKFWRSMTQWIGGLGIVFFTIAILPSMVGGSMKVFSAEATGPIRTKLHPRLSTTAKWIWSIYLALTIACGIVFWICGMDIFDSANYSMTVTATGGFSTHNASTGYFHNPYIDYSATLFMFLSGTSFTLLYLAMFKHQLKDLLTDMEFRMYGLMVIVATLSIAYFLFTKNGYDLEKAFRMALFQVVSFATTTGVFNDDAGKWPHITWVILSICMFLGGCAGSTAGGIKCIRGVMTLKIVRNEIKHVLHPKAVLPVKIRHKTISSSSQVTLLSFFVLYFCMCVFAYFILILMGVDSTNSITIAISCASNVGPTLGLEIGPTMAWDHLPAIGKWICSCLMLMGRLEIMTVIVLFTRSFWKVY